ncbi:MAG: hypothetical protein DLM67_10760 [Candidatus Nephthysia bennettiae]|nr:MAG: hypothetical protein DLM67_10760 [Candidatus Dormibacteraeota bacterium]
MVNAVATEHPRSPAAPAVPAEEPAQDFRRPSRPRWLRIALAAAGLWLATRVAYAVFTYVAVALGSPAPKHARALLEAWDQYDTHWYLLISRLDYTQPAMTAFFPLYPTLIGRLAALLGDAQGPVWPAYDGVRLLVALGLASLFTLLALVGVALLAVQESGEERAGPRAVWALLAYPFAFFLAAGYTEGPFLAAAAFTLYFARRGAWPWAVLAALVAGLVRPTAVALVLPLAWEYARQHDWGRGLPLAGWTERLRAVGGGMAVVGAVPLATGAYALFLWHRFGTPLVWFRVQSAVWHRQTTPPWRTALQLGHRLLTYPAWSHDQAMLLLAVVPLLLFLAVVAVSLRTMPFAFVLYTAAICYLAVSAPVASEPELIESTGRFLLAAIPVFLVIGAWMRRRPAFAQLWIASGLMLQGVLLVNFFAGRWVA